MSQSAVVAISSGFIMNGILTWIFPEGNYSFIWIISGLVALFIGTLTIKFGDKKIKFNKKKLFSFN